MISKRNKAKVFVYKDIINEYQQINAWTNNECLPVNSSIENDYLSNCCVIELSIEGTHGNNNAFQNKISIFYSFLENYLFTLSSNKYFFSVSEKKVKNRIRSHKGIIPKDIKKEDYIQFEIDLEENYSIIIALVKVNRNNYQIMKEILFDRSKHCILVNNENIYSKEYLFKIYEEVLNKKSFSINYWHLCNLFKEDNLIIRESGDGGDQEFSWQFFLLKSDYTNVMKTISKSNTVLDLEISDRGQQNKRNT